MFDRLVTIERRYLELEKQIALPVTEFSHTIDLADRDQSDLAGWILLDTRHTRLHKHPSQHMEV